MKHSRDTNYLIDVSLPLPVASYLEPEIYEIEKQRIFERGPRYIGCQRAIPEVGDYLALEAEDGARMIVNTKKGTRLLSNVCRHRQAIMLQGRGRVDRIECALHRWSYDHEGTLLRAPRFDPAPCRHLETFPIHSWNHLIFEGSDAELSIRDIPSNIMSEIDLSRYVFDRVEHIPCKYNWKTFLEFYLEDYHVASFHPGLSNFVNSDDLTWHFGKNYSIQSMALQKQFKSDSCSSVYQTWQSAVEGYYGKNRPAVGAIWMYIYPNIMIEWYPMVLVVSTIFPLSPERSINQVEFYHPEEIVLFDRQWEYGVRAAAAAYLETAIEDDEIGRRMQIGRRALWHRGKSDAGPYQTPLELGMAHFHKLYRAAMQI